MEAYIWANDLFSEYRFFVAFADSIEEARDIISDEIMKDKEFSQGKLINGAGNFSYQKEWLEYINNELPIVLCKRDGGVFLHANE